MSLTGHDDEVYVQTFPAPGGKWQISTAGGSIPRWRRGRTELFYLAADGKLMAAAVNTGPTFEAGVARVLFQTQMSGFGNKQDYAVTSNGQRFLITLTDFTSSPISVVVNWTAALTW